MCGLPPPLRFEKGLVLLLSLLLSQLKLVEPQRTGRDLSSGCP